MSQPESELDLVNSLREMLNYISILGEHINQIYEHLEKVEIDIGTVKEELKASIMENKEEIKRVKSTIITKSKLDDILQKLNKPFEKFIPPKTPEQRS